MSLFQKIEAGDENNFLTLDVADLNRNGRAEIIVTSVVEDDLQSFILEYEEGKFKKIPLKSNWFFRVVVLPKEGPVLLGQQRGSEGLPIDPVYRMVWKKKSFEKGPIMPFPKGTGIFGVAMADIRGKGKPETIFLDESERLNIFSEDGKIQWKSSDRFGGTSNYYDTTKKKNDNYRDDTPWRFYISERVLVKDLNRDGMLQVIVNKNEPTSKLLKRSRSFEKGEIYSLAWDEGGLVTNWKTRPVLGYIADYQVKDVDNDGNEELVVAVVGSDPTKGPLSAKKASTIYFFKLF
jgi:hypothetical protein